MEGKPTESAADVEASGAKRPDVRAGLREALEKRLTEELGPRLQLLRLIGRGSAASVYLAREPALRRLVAIKVLSPELANDQKARLRFQREAQSSARIAHPNVVTVFWVDSLADGLPYIVMEFVEGRSLEDRLKAEGVLEAEDVRRILASIASGLSAAHRKRIVHRDIKPANVLYEEETGRVLLTDFGIAAILASGDEEITHLTTAGHVLGDMRYVSPEALSGEELTEYTDIYSLGVLGFELLTGQIPYEYANRAELISAHLNSDPRGLAGLVEDVDAILEELLARCVDKVPAHRPRAADVLRHLRAEIPVDGGEPDDEIPAAEVAEPVPQTAAAPPVAPDGSAADVSLALDPPPEIIQLFTLQSLDLKGTDGNRMLSVLAQPKRIALLAYLAIGSHLGFKRRDTLLGVFWPEMTQDRARHSLRQALYVLRRGLGANIVMSRGDEEVGIDPARLWCDAVALEHAIETGHAADALTRYTADLLPGFYVSDAPEFERWLEGERHRLHRRASDAAWALVDACEADGQPAEAARWARQAMDFAPFDETSVCRLIQLLDRLGDRAGAMETYDRFARLLVSEYQAEPAPETQELIARVRSR